MRSPPRVGGEWFTGTRRTVPALTGTHAHYGALVGSKVAVFGVTRRPTGDPAVSFRDALAEQVLTRIGEVEVGEGMPHPIIGGVWGKKSEAANAPYLILGDLSTANLRNAAQWAEDLGFASVYRNTQWGVTTGGGTLSVSSNFGGSDTALRTLIQTTERDFRVGIGSHSLANWLGFTNQVARANRQGLAFLADAVLASNVGIFDPTLTLSPLPGTDLDNLRSGFPPNPGNDRFLLIDDEILSYSGAIVSGNNVQLTGLQRGQHASSRATHESGASVRRLWNEGYGGSYQAGFDMMVDTIAPRYAQLIDLGVADFSFDGMERAKLSHDVLGMSAFLQTIYDSLADKEDFVHDMSTATSHSWHVNSRANWGETANDITRAHQKYRWGNQVYFQRNYFPRMMGWWSIDDANEWRWAMARAAAFDAGFGYFGNAGDYSRYNDALRAEIRGWRNAQLAGAFDEANRFLMHERDEYFKLDPVRRTGQLGPAWRLSDWTRFGANGGVISAGTSRYIAPQMGGHPLVNVARDAAVTASSHLDSGVNPDLAVDGSTGAGAPFFAPWWPRFDGMGEWIAGPDDANPWVQLNWEAPRKIRRIMLFDRENPDHNATAATLTFSDGSSIAVDSIPADGDARVVDFVEKTVTWARYSINASAGDQPGLAEFVVLGPSAEYANGNLATDATVAGTNGGRVTDGRISGAASDAFLPSGTSTTLDLGGHYLIGGLNVWRDFAGAARQYRDVIFEIADNEQFDDAVSVFNNDFDNSLGKGAGSDAAYTETSAGKPVYFAPVPGRYVRIWSNGSGVNTTNYLSEVEVYGVGSGTGGATVTTSNRGMIDNPGLFSVIDHSLDLGRLDVGPGRQYVQINLASTKTVNSLVVVRDHGARRIYENVVWQLSDNPAFPPEATVTVFNNDHGNVHGLDLGETTDGEYLETENGRYVRFAPVPARYVRLYSNGSNYDDRNRYLEVLVGTAQAGTEPVAKQASSTEFLITPNAVDVTSGGQHPQERAARLTDSSGLSVTPTIFNYETAIHTGIPTSWSTSQRGIPNYFIPGREPAQLVLGLPSTLYVTALVIWGHGYSAHDATDFEVEFSTDGGTSYGTAIQVKTDQALAGGSATTLRFESAHQANAVRLSVTQNAGSRGFGGLGGDRVGLGELRFIGSLGAPQQDPDVISVTGVNGSYIEGDHVDITVHFQDAVKVEPVLGAPTLSLETGTVDRLALYQGGSGTAELAFRYTVEAGDVSSNLQYTGVDALALNGAAIANIAGGGFPSLALPALHDLGSLGQSSRIVVGAQGRTRDFWVFNGAAEEGEDIEIPVLLFRAGQPAAAAVDYEIFTAEGDEARPGADYAAASGTLSFAPGEHTKILSVATVADRVSEPDETFTVQLSNASANARIGKGAAKGIIINVEAGSTPRPQPTPGGSGGSGGARKAAVVTIADGAAVEGESLRFRVSVEEPLNSRSRTLDFQATTHPGIATEEADYTGLRDHRFRLLAGETETVVEVPTLTDDVFEDGETFRVTIEAVGSIAREGLVELARTTAVGTILDADGPSRRIPLFPAAANAKDRQGFVRVVNHGDTPAAVEIEAFDNAGLRYGPVSLSVGARATTHFNSGDLEDGNEDKGLSGSIGPGQGDWRLDLHAGGGDIEAYAYMRTGDGFLTSLHDLAPVAEPRSGEALPGEAVYRVPIFNPGANANQVSSLRLINAGEESAAVTVKGIDDVGALGGPVRLVLQGGESRTIPAADLESGSGLEGSLGDGAGKWRLTVAADRPLRVQSLLESPPGHLTNLSTVPDNKESPAAADGGTLHRVPLFPSAADLDGRQGFVRVVNRGDAGGPVTIRAYDDSEWDYEPVVLKIGVGETVHFNSDDLEQGNPAKGLSGGVGTGTGDWRLELTSMLGLDVFSYIRTGDGLLTAMHDTVPASPGGGHAVPIFNPGVNVNQVSSLRLVNPGEETAEVTIRGVDDTGASPGSAVRLFVPGGMARTVTARELESGGEALAGSLGDGAGKWRLIVASDRPIRVLSLLSSPTGHLTNLSTAPE